LFITGSRVGGLFTATNNKIINKIRKNYFFFEKKKNEIL